MGSILIVDNNREASAQLQGMLQRLGHSIPFVASSPREALEVAQELRLDLVLVRLRHTSELDGISTAAAFRERFDIPAIFLGSTLDELTLERAKMTEPYGYLLEPLEEAELRSTIELALQRRETEARQTHLAMQERLISIGTMVAGVAHEVNNPLSYVISSVELVQQEIPQLLSSLREHAQAQDSIDPIPSSARGQPEPLAQMIKRIENFSQFLDMALHGAERVRDIVRDLAIFSQASEGVVLPIPIEPVIEATMRLAWNEIRHRAKLTKNYRKTPRVNANEAKLSQALLNLLLNAAHSIPIGDAQQNEIQIVTDTSPAGLAIVEIRDSGCGIPAENLPHVFDPFFTTKPVGSGTGLGLSICHGIINSIGGTIEVESRLGEGSVFRILLPPALEASLRIQESSPAQQSSTRTRVLIVDDEPMLAEAFRHALAANHEVDSVNSGKMALERIVDGERYSVILCDLMMPDLSGMDLHTLLERLAPDQASRMIFITGGAFTPSARTFLEKVQNPRMRKPVSLVELRALVQRAAI